MYGYVCENCGAKGQDLAVIEALPCPCVVPRKPLDSPSPAESPQVLADQQTAERMQLEELKKLEEEGAALEKMLEAEQLQLQEMLLEAEVQELQQLLFQEEEELRVAKIRSLEELQQKNNDPEGATAGHKREHPEQDDSKAAKAAKTIAQQDYEVTAAVEFATEKLSENKAATPGAPDLTSTTL